MAIIIKERASWLLYPAVILLSEDFSVRDLTPSPTYCSRIEDSFRYYIYQVVLIRGDALNAPKWTLEWETRKRKQKGRRSEVEC